MLFFLWKTCQYFGLRSASALAALMAAEAGSHLSLPGPLHVAAILAVALISGAAWAGISAFLKVRKNIHEVISTIMLNYIALSFIQWIFNDIVLDAVGKTISLVVMFILNVCQMGLWLFYKRKYSIFNYNTRIIYAWFRTQPTTNALCNLMQFTHGVLQ